MEFDLRTMDWDTCLSRCSDPYIILISFVLTITMNEVSIDYDSVLSVFFNVDVYNSVNSVTPT